MNEIESILAQNNKAKILFVDDEKSILSSLQRVCRSNEYQVFTAEGGQAGLDIMKEHNIDLVVSDMRMPKMNGAEFLELVANKYPDTVRILLTGYSDIESTIAAINQGKIQSFIQKPWDNDQLKTLLQTQLCTKRLKDEHQKLVELTNKQNKQLQELNDSLEERVTQRTTELQHTVSKLDKAHQELKGAYTSSVEVFSRLIELREAKATNNSNYVAKHVNLIAKQIELEPNSIEQLHYAALLRNIGKMGLSDTAITKPFELLDSADKVAYKKHPALGEALLMSVEALQDAASYIRNHRERVDGKGFPDGLVKEDIPLEARILAVASDYEDMTSGMMSEVKLTPEKAQDYIRSQAGKRYDKIIVSVYLNILHELNMASIRQNEVKLSTNELKPGMTLSNDLVTPDGLLLLSGKQQLSERLIDKIRKFERDAHEKFSIYILEL